MQVDTLPVDQFLDQGLMEAQSLLVLDLERCTRCDQCVRACADAHDGVTRLIREGLRFDKYLVATSCRQCRDPLCMVGCPVGSIRRATRSKSSSRTGASAAACAPTTARTATSTCIRSRSNSTIPRIPAEDRDVAAESNVLRLVPRPRRAKLRVRLPARRGASRESTGIFWRLADERQPINHTRVARAPRTRRTVGTTLDAD